MKANEFFIQEWGTGFTKATLSEKNGLLEMSMEDIYSTMERYAELRSSNVVWQSEQVSKNNCTYCGIDINYKGLCEVCYCKGNDAYEV